MQIGIFAKTFDGADPETILAAAANASYATVQYNMACSGLPSLPTHVTPEHIEAIESAIENSGVSICALSATYNMVHPDSEIRNKGLASLEVLAGAAQSLNVRLLTLCTGSRNPLDQWAHHVDNQTPEAWADLRAAMEKALAIAEAHDLYLGIEPEHGNVVNSSTAAKQLIAELGSSRLKVIIDPANLVSTESATEQKIIIATAIEQVAGHIVLAHAKDRNSNGEVVASGQGVIDFPHFISRLKNGGYDGPLVTHGLAASEAMSVRKFLEGIVQ